MLPADRFVDRLLGAGFDFFVGVPCSLVKTLLAELERRRLYLGETREDAALGVAAGAYLAGRMPVVVMQNSGLGVSLNALGSLHLLYRIPCLLLVTWRGFDGKDAHREAGRRDHDRGAPISFRGVRADATAASTSRTSAMSAIGGS